MLSRRGARLTVSALIGPPRVNYAIRVETGASVLKLFLWIVVCIFALISVVVAANYIYSNGRQNGFCDALETLVAVGRISPADGCTAEDRPPRLPFLIGP
jgi:hypothetical protein